MKVIEKKYLLPFILVTSLFALQGMVSDHSTINMSYLVPMACFLVVLVYAAYSIKTAKPQNL